jgi:hypothetical protein
MLGNCDTKLNEKLLSDDMKQYKIEARPNSWVQIFFQTWLEKFSQRLSLLNEHKWTKE